MTQFIPTPKPRHQMDAAEELRAERARNHRYDCRKLAQARRRAGLTQQNVAEGLKVTRNLVGEWEVGKCPNGEYMLRLLILLEAKPEDVMSESI